MKKYNLIVIWIFSCISSVLSCYTYLFKGYEKGDDWFFVHQGPLTLNSIIHTLNPYTINWFYRPTYMLESLFWNRVLPGHAYYPHFYHIILFSIVVTLLSVFLYKLTENMYTTFLSVMFFFTCTYQNEAISWLCCGSVLYASVFSLASIINWMKYRESNSTSSMVWTFLFLILALCSKEEAIALPIILVLLDIYWYKKPLLLNWQWMGIFSCLGTYLGLETIAYTHSVNFHYQQNIGGHHGVNLEVIAHFLHLNLLGFLPSVTPVGGFILPICIIIPLLFLRIGNNPLYKFLFVASVVSCLVTPAAAGAQCFSSRFNFYPLMFIIPFWVLTFAKISQRSSHRLQLNLVMLALAVLCNCWMGNMEVFNQITLLIILLVIQICICIKAKKLISTHTLTVMIFEIFFVILKLIDCSYVFTWIVFIIMCAVPAVIHILYIPILNKKSLYVIFIDELIFNVLLIASLPLTAILSTCTWVVNNEII